LYHTLSAARCVVYTTYSTVVKIVLSATVVVDPVDANIISATDGSEFGIITPDAGDRRAIFIFYIIAKTDNVNNIIAII